MAIHLDKVSGESIKVVCDVVLAAFPEVFRRLAGAAK
jgi:hypothetical protein